MPNTKKPHNLTLGITEKGSIPPRHGLLSNSNRAVGIVSLGRGEIGHKLINVVVVEYVGIEDHEFGTKKINLSPDKAVLCDTIFFCSVLSCVERGCVVAFYDIGERHVMEAII